ncbi:calcium-binding protein [Oceanospirillum sediminis]|uniref:Haemolysin-type calcium binding-related domain-containing protein n=1 Tax=Oceanospirillum sediminis TaxID=2760088 RepID=A0A839IPK8_9GAMM|nr:calcium-binding protein [Oceanospirillum sediminis]MBB1486419.1 hypothetical protein [Oceanospirillum sediminis]
MTDNNQPSNNMTSISGNAGDNRLRGSGAENEYIQGKEGNDDLAGYRPGDYPTENAYDLLSGGTGDDKLYAVGGSQADLYGDEGNDQITIIENLDNRDLAGNIKIYGGDGDDTVKSYAGDGIKISGGSGKDKIIVYGGTDVEINGNSGNDSIYLNKHSGGYHGDIASIINPGEGNDYVRGSMYSEVLLFNRGDGADRINLASLTTSGRTTEQNIIRFGDNISVSDIDLDDSGSQYIITLKENGINTSDSITILYQDNILLEFADGTSYDINNLPAPVYGTDGNDVISSYQDIKAGDGDDLITLQHSSLPGEPVRTAEGEAGNDTITGESAAGTHLKGGTGDDTLITTMGYNEGMPDAPVTILEGGIGNDQIRTTGSGNEIRFGLGDGQDTLSLTEDWNRLNDDYIQFGAGITQNDLRLITFTDSQDMLLQILQNGEPTGDTMTIQVADGYNQTDYNYTLKFTDGTETSLLSVDGYLQGTSAADTISSYQDIKAGDGDDLITLQHSSLPGEPVRTAEGEAGNDTITGESAAGTHLKGGAGDDTLITTMGYNEGMPDAPVTILEGGIGNDQIRTTGSGNEIRFGLGDGQDTLSLTEDWNRLNDDYIQFGAGITQNDLRLITFTDSQDMLLQILQNGEPTGDTLTIQVADGYNQTDYNYTLKFTDGTETSLLSVDGYLQGTSAADTISSYQDIKAGDGDDLITLQHSSLPGEPVRTAEGEAGNDTITGESAAGTHLKGGAGDDTLITTMGYNEGMPDAPVTILEGGTGNDQIRTTGSGNEIRFGLGDGQDTLSLTEDWHRLNDDYIQFGAGITQNDLRLITFTDSQDMLLQILQNGEPTGDTLTIQVADGYNQINYDYMLKFADGTEIKISQLPTPLMGTDSADILYADSSQHIGVKAGAGDDTIHVSVSEYATEVFIADGEAGNDILITNAAAAVHLKGGAGDDQLEVTDNPVIVQPDTPAVILEGGIGNDTIKTSEQQDIILFNSGDGYDTVTFAMYQAPDSQPDIIRFGEGISASDLSFQGSVDLEISVNNSGQPTGDQITITDIASVDSAIQLEFADGTSHNLSDFWLI